MMLSTTRPSQGSQEVRLRGPIPVAERLRWLVNFGQPSSRPMNSRSQERLIRTLAGYLREVVLRREGTGEGVEVSALPLRGEDDQKSAAEKLALIRRRIHTLLQQHLSHKKPRPQAHIRLRVTVNEDGYLSSQCETDDLRDALAYVLVVELGEFGQRLRRCAAAKCRRLFVRQRRQRFCSAACRNRATFKRWYRRHIVASAGSGKTAVLAALAGTLDKHEGRAVRRRKVRRD